MSRVFRPGGPGLRRERTVRGTRRMRKREAKRIRQTGNYLTVHHGKHRSFGRSMRSARKKMRKYRATMESAKRAGY